MSFDWLHTCVLGVCGSRGETIECSTTDREKGDVFSRSRRGGVCLHLTVSFDLDTKLLVQHG